MWISILQFIITSALLTALLTYFFNQKLEKQKTALKVSEQFYTLLITALNQLMSDYKAIILKIEEVEDCIKSDDFENELFKDLEELSQDYNGTLRVHRIYLSALVPYGKSTGKFFAYDDVNLVAVTILLRIIKWMRNESDKTRFNKYKDMSLKLVVYAKASYESVCNKANVIINHLQEGKNPYFIKWEEITPYDWVETSRKIQVDLLTLDIERDRLGLS
jgi:hypothetical protein